jgi:predicted DCC family thiol-disulfide oxidoreductase YuxK
MTELQPQIETPIVFFDGDCGLCDHFVQFMLNHDARGVVRFSALQGKTYRETVFPVLGPSDLTTVILWDAGNAYTHSDAVLRATQRLGGLIGVSSRMALFVPRAIRNGVYRLVAKNRYRLFGKVDACRIPQPSERERFLP